ncbi:MAG: nicotinate phosphoribosyltransferase [Ruminococcaceae bacterium]|nr:nicotinate phosphoribosyltransferase [Oscillospiraceae bacterium]
MVDNYALLSDFYEFTMSNGYHLSGLKDKISYFDIFFREIPDNGGFAIFCGLEQVVKYIKNLKFTKSDLEYLRSKKIFSEDYLKSLENFKFTGDIWAVPEGTVIFPNEPVMTIRARTVEAQVMETYLLTCLNHQSLIATKSNRIVRAAKGRTVLEFGARRAQGAEAAYLGARASYIAGCSATSNALADKLFQVPAAGTMAHSWVQIFEDEYTAFRTYCEIYPQNPSLLVDTYNVLKSGVPNAIKVFKEVGISDCSIRIDSGDIAYLSIKARKMLDEAGMTDCKIVASNSLDENIIRDVISQGGKVDVFGVGERLITAKSDPVFGGVYKLVALEDGDEIVPKIKVSENVTKITTPHFKKLYRLYDRDSHKALADLLCVYDETLDDSSPIEIFDPEFTWKRKLIENFYARNMLIPIFKQGKQVYKLPSIEEIKVYCRTEVESLWDETKRFENPHKYYVDMSQKLWGIRHELLKDAARR